MHVRTNLYSGARIDYVMKQHSKLMKLDAMVYNETQPPRYDTVNIGKKDAHDSKYGGSFSTPVSNGMRHLYSSGTITWAKNSDEQDLKLNKWIRIASEEEEDITSENILEREYKKAGRLLDARTGEELNINDLLAGTAVPKRQGIVEPMTKENLEKFRKELNEKADRNELDVDFIGIREDFNFIGIRDDNAKWLSKKVDYISSRYVAARDLITKNSPLDERDKKLKELDKIFSDAKKELVDTYVSEIGGFYKNLGQTDASKDMRESLNALIDKRVNDYTRHIESNKDYTTGISHEDRWLLKNDAFLADRLRKSESRSANSNNVSNTKYSMNDLQFAGVYKEALNKQLEHYYYANTDKELGENLAEQLKHSKKAFASAGLTKPMQDMLTDSFEPFIDKLILSIDRKITANREQLRKAPHLAATGNYRTSFINRQEVLKAFREGIK